MLPHPLHSRFKHDFYETDVFALCLPTVKAVGYTATAPHGAGIVASLINLKSYNLITLYVAI